MKILHILRSHAIAGAENHIFMLLPALQKRGYEVGLLTLSDGRLGNMTGEYRKRLEEMGAYGIAVVESRVRHKWDWTAIPKLRRIISGFRPDLVHTHLPYADLFGGIAARWAGVPAVISSRHYDYSFSKWEVIKAKFYYLWANPWHDGVIATSGRVAELCRKVEGWSAERVHTVLHGCSEQRVDKASSRAKVIRELGLPQDVFLVGTVARLIDLKGHRFAIEAFAQLTHSLDNMYWLFVGDGPQKETLMKLAGEKGVADRLLFLGHRTDIPELMAAMDLMVHPTTGEGFGLIFLEAMIQSTPVVSTRTGAIPEIIADGKSGLLVEPRDPSGLAEAITTLARDPQLLAEFGQEGRRRYEERFTLDVMADNIHRVYQGIRV